MDPSQIKTRDWNNYEYYNYCHDYGWYYTIFIFLNSIFHPLFLSFLGTFLVGFGSGIYLISNLGPGTRDGLMTGISNKFCKPISLVRFSIELIVVLIGWILGGTLGVGTIIFAVFIGPFVSISLKLVSFIHK